MPDFNFPWEIFLFGNRIHCKRKKNISGTCVSCYQSFLHNIIYAARSSVGGSYAFLVLAFIFNTLLVKKNIAILVNSKAGQGIVAKITLAVSQFLDGLYPHHTFKDYWPDTLEGFTEVWIIGGDGTVNFSINKYRNLMIPFAIIKAGTGNDFAWHLYGEKTLQQQLKLISNTQAKPVDAAECNGQLFLNGMGIGFDGEVVKSVKRLTWLSGHAGYMWTVIKNILTFKEKSFVISVNGRTLPVKLLLLIIANGSRVGGGFNVSPASSITDSKLDLVTCEPLSILRRIRYLPVIEKGRHLHLPFISHQLIDEIKVLSVDKMYAHIDGELLHASEFIIRIHPAKFMVLY